MQNPSDQKNVLQGDTDRELERMLDDAYDVPPIPRSLVKRLDQAVEQQWGCSPGFLAHEPSMLASTVARGRRLLVVWPIAAGITLIVLAVVAFQNSAHAYGWAKMIRALARAEMVQLDGSDGNSLRWMSAASGVVGERSMGSTRLFDFGRGIVLKREAGEQMVKRFSFARSANTSQQEAVVIAFLVTNVEEEADSVRQSDLTLIEESWSSVGSDEVELRVKLGSTTETAELRIVVDRKTHLPKNFQIAGTDLPNNQVALSYPGTAAAVFLTQHFPPDLPVVNAVAATAATADLAQRLPESAADTVVVEKDETSAGGTPDVASLLGAASLQWQPVKTTTASSAEAVAQVDSILQNLWQENGIEPAGAAGDEELLRRVYLDLAGRTPTVSEVRNYLADESPNRYVQLVDQLLSSRDHATHLAAVWRTYLIPEGIDLSRFGGRQSFERWIGKQFADRVPYDEIVRRLLLAEGRLTQSGPLLFYAAVKMDPDQLATRSARVFLGMRLDCAQCHDDHFEPWLQEDFWGYAAFFARISRPQGMLRDVSTVMRVRDVERGEVKLPESDTVVSPRFLDGSPIDDDVASMARRRQLAEWLTGPDNPYFARATANRIWGLLFGKGIVDPVDGFGTQHDPVSQELLDRVAGHFLASEFDMRELFRTIVLSRAYRLSSGAETLDPKRHKFFAQMNVKLLTAEQMYDCVTVASMLVSAEAETGFNLSRVGNTNRDQFLRQFRAPPGRSTEYQAGIPQALTLMNGELIDSATNVASSGLLKTLEMPLLTNEERSQILYLATLARMPTASEQELLNEFISETTSGDELYKSLADVLWALLNSAEFTMNH